MAERLKVELRTTHEGQAAQLIIDGVDVSRKAKAVTINYDCRQPGPLRASVLVEYDAFAADIQVEGEFVPEDKE